MDCFTQGSRSIVRAGQVVAVLAIMVLWTSCGEFRQTIFPVDPNPPDPESLHFVLALTDNGPVNPGASSRIDVSGDTNLGFARVGLGPIHAALIPPSGSVVFVANQLEDTVSAYSTSSNASVSTITLPAGSSPSYVHTMQVDRVYVANSGNNTVSVISANNRVVTKTISVGTNPVAMAGTPNGSKLYVVNRGSGNVSSINTLDGTVGNTITVGANPVWAVSRSDNAFVYVLNQGSGISVIDTATEAAPTSVAVPGATTGFYDKALNRLYFTVPGTTRLSVLNVAVNPPVALPDIDLTAACPGCVLDSVTALLDGSRVYVASHQISATCTDVTGLPTPTDPCITTRVTVVRAPVNTVSSTITTQHRVVSNGILLGTRTDVPVIAACDSIPNRRYIVASGATDETSRVYVSNCDGGTIDIIRTRDDTFTADLIAPVSSDPPPVGQDFPPPQRPVFVLSGR